MNRIAIILWLGILLAQNQVISGQDDSRTRGRQDDRHGDRGQALPTAVSTAPSNGVAPNSGKPNPSATHQGVPTIATPGLPPVDEAAPRTTP